MKAKSVSVCIFASLFVFVHFVIFTACDLGKLSNQNLDDFEQVAELKQVDGNTLTVCDINLMKDTMVLPLSYFTKELHIIKLDNSNDDYLVDERFAIVGEQYLLIAESSINDIPYRLFDKSGKFIANIGSIGNGPNEYQYIHSAQLNEKSNRIYLLPYMGDRIFVYDLEGNYYPPIPLPFSVALFSSFHVDPIAGTVSVFTPPLNDKRFSPYCAWTQNMSGEIIHAIESDLYSSGMSHEQPFNNRIFKNNNTTEQTVFFYDVKSSHKDTLYNYDINNDVLAPKFTIDFKDREIPLHVYTEFPSHYIGYTYELIPDEHLPNTTIIANHKNFIIDKNTLKGGYYKLINDFLGNIEIETGGEPFVNGYYTVNFDPLHFAEILENALVNNDMYSEMRKKLTDLKNSINENDNNYIVYSKFKQ